MPSLNRLAEFYLVQGKAAEADPYAKRSVTIGRLKVGLQPPSFAEAQHRYAAVLAALGKFDDAIPLYVNALAAKSRQLPEAAHIPPKPGQIAHADFADLCKEAAACYRGAGKEKEAKELEAKAELILKPKQ
jgi:tetratricopeptide (TPR) repeat protein